MSNPILKISRNGYDINKCEDKDLSFDSRKETPKIFATKVFSSFGQHNLPINYSCAFYPFRKLNSTDWTHDITLNNGQYDDPTRGTYISGNVLYCNPYPGESGISAILYFDQLNETSSNELNIDTHPYFILAKENENVGNIPINHSIDSRFDTFKIFKSGTLVLSMPSETITSDTTHSISITHNLGYPCFYLPEIGKNWSLQIPGLMNSSFIVNDYLGSAQVNFRTGDYVYGQDKPFLSVWVDNDKLYMSCTRNAGTYNAVDITLYYTLFYNDVSEDFDLL